MEIAQPWKSSASGQAFRVLISDDRLRLVVVSNYRAQIVPPRSTSQQGRRASKATKKEFSLQQASDTARYATCKDSRTALSVSKRNMQTSFTTTVLYAERHQPDQEILSNLHDALGVPHSLNAHVLHHNVNTANLDP